MGFRSRYDYTGRCQEMGESAEKIFEGLAKEKKLNPIAAVVLYFF